MFLHNISQQSPSLKVAQYLCNDVCVVQISALATFFYIVLAGNIHPSYLLGPDINLDRIIVQYLCRDVCVVQKSTLMKNCKIFFQISAFATFFYIVPLGIIGRVEKRTNGINAYGYCF